MKESSCSKYPGDLQLLKQTQQRAGKELLENISAEGLGVTDRVPFVRKPDAKKYIKEQKQIPNSIFIARFENYTVQKFWNHTQNN